MALSKQQLTAAGLILAGLFTIVCALADWDWFMNDRKARLFVGLFGRQGARMVYIILGTLILAFGAFSTSL